MSPWKNASAGGSTTARTPPDEPGILPIFNVLHEGGARDRGVYPVSANFPLAVQRITSPARRGTDSAVELRGELGDPRQGPATTTGILVSEGGRPAAP